MNSNRAVLHVDDDPQFTRAVAARLAISGFDVRTLNDSRRVLDELAREHYRVVLLDIDMPYFDGLEVLRQIKSYDGGIQVIMLTGIVTMAAVLQSLRTGSEACLFKPVRDIEPLVGVIDDAFRKLDRWWLALDELSRRRQKEVELLASARS